MRNVLFEGVVDIVELNLVPSVLELQFDSKIPGLVVIDDLAFPYKDSIVPVVQLQNVIG